MVEYNNSMKKIIVLLVTLFAVSFSFALEKAPFRKGVNLSNWFEAWNPGSANYKMFDKTDFVHIKKLGADVVRVPIHFENLSSGKNEYIVNPIVWKYLDQACDWAEELGMYIVIDNHSFNGTYRPKAKELEQHLSAVWTQVAQRYKNRSSYIIYEILNEPNSVSCEQWNEIQEGALKIIRQYDSKHTIVVTGADWGGINSMKKTTLYDDSNLIYSFHFYNPMMFTHQGADWSGKLYNYISNIPFPYDKSRMPSFPNQKLDSWSKAEFDAYKNNATVEAIRSELLEACQFGKDNKVAVWCGEMGVYNKVAPVKDAGFWYKTVGSALAEYDIPFTVWDYAGPFGLFEKNSKAEFPYDLSEEIVTGCGFVMPKITGTRPEKKLSLPLTIFDDCSGKKMFCWSDSHLDTSYVDNDNICIKAENLGQYEGVQWAFEKSDFSGVNLSETFVELNVMFTQKNQVLELRLIDSEEEKQIPWRMSFFLDAKKYELNKWQKVRIPLSSMSETGAWISEKNQWCPARNEFDWARISLLRICAEQEPVPGKILIDEIKIVFRKIAEPGVYSKYGW